MPPRPAVRPRPVLALAITALVLSTLPPAEAKSSPVEWLYTIKVEDPGSGVVEVALQITKAKGVMTQLTFHPSSGEYEVRNFRGDGVTAKDGAYELTIDEDLETVRYEVDVRREAPGKADEYASYLDDEGGLLKAEAVALRYEYNFYADNPPVFSTRVKFVLPGGWSAEAPWERDGSNAFRLPGTETLPRGFVAVGRFTAATHSEDGREFRYVKLGDAKSEVSKDEIFRYLQTATPYYESVYGKVVGDVVLVVSWGDPMFTGGLGGHDSLYIHDDADLRTLSHEYAHVWQMFIGGGETGESTIWVNEGDAEYHGTLAMVATGEWSVAQANEFLEKAYEVRRDAKQGLEEGVYGEHDDAIAYKKGVVFWSFLDDAIRENTDGRKDASDLLKALNRLYEDPEDGPRRVTPLENRQVLDALNDLVGKDFREAWDRYVYGPEWPQLVRVEDRDDLALLALELVPEAATPGSEVTVRVAAENRGFSDVDREFVVALDGEEIGVVAFDLTSSRRSGDAVLNFTAPAPGAHKVKVGYLTADFRSLTPASLSVDRISIVPATPRAGEPVSVLVYVRNDGEAAAPTKVQLSLGGVVVGEKALNIDGNVTVAATFEVTPSQGGETVLRATVQDDGRARTASETVDVLPADRDGDGVPDADDAFPENPKLSEGGPVNSVRNEVAAPAFAALALVAAALALGRRWS